MSGEEGEGSSRARLFVAGLLAFFLPLVLSGFAAGVTPGGYWAKAATEGFAFLLGTLIAGRVGRSRAFLVVGIGLGIPWALFFIGGLTAYAEGRLRLSSLLLVSAYVLASLVLAYGIGRRSSARQQRVAIRA